MPLELHGPAIIHPNGKEVRFAGYPVQGRPQRIVICVVLREALLALGNIPDANDDDLLEVFELYREDILKAASKQFDDGVHRPTLTAGDIADQ